MKTKDRIVGTAIQLYNENGFSNITSRHIARKIKISHGNLEYHFPNKESLLFAIYEQMREEISSFYTGQDKEVSNPVEHLHKLLVRLEEFQWKYKFFNLDVLEISRNYEKVNLLLKDTLQIRKTQMSGLFQRFINEQYMKPEPVAGYYYRVQHTIRILITFWNSQEVVLSNFDFNQRGEMVRHIWDLLLPHFTEKGIKEYEAVNQKFPLPELNQAI
ncbi:TetR/AcrR family transcriptional regulator [Reichenbachiella sp. MALMAid0571]|uniref:TetR/AcrR family transcriptional regulator n=1 Tax=Reichenbachiella sp. MALMAid0571 TaxID=3143939 RepID=UPI0032DFB036